MSPTTPRVDPLSYLADELEQMKAQGLYRHLRVLEDEQRAHTTFDGRSVVNLSSNNYLGLTTHPRLREKALAAIERYGVGTGSVRTIAGTMSLHMELERRLAEFKHTEATVVFQSGFAANAGTVLGDPHERGRSSFRAASRRTPARSRRSSRKRTSSSRTS
jgi:glycine C-acetyltransferase